MHYDRHTAIRTFRTEGVDQNIVLYRATMICLFQTLLNMIMCLLATVALRG